MTEPIFPSVGEDGKIRDDHLPARLSDSALTEKIESMSGGASLTEDPDNPGLYLIGE